jgi:hypothetical protein
MYVYVLLNRSQMVFMYVCVYVCMYLIHHLFFRICPKPLSSLNETSSTEESFILESDATETEEEEDSPVAKQHRAGKSMKRLAGSASRYDAAANEVSVNSSVNEGYADEDDEAVNEVPADKVPADEVPADEVPADEDDEAGAVNEVPADEVPADEVPADEVPADEVPGAAAASAPNEDSPKVSRSRKGSRGSRSMTRALARSLASNEEAAEELS